MGASAFVLLSFVLLPAIAGQSNVGSATGGQAAGQVTVEGKVVDNHGVPVAKAEVAFYAYSGGHSGPMPGAITGADGSFVIHMPPLGAGAVTAFKPEAGYPNAVMALYGKGRPSEQRINATVAASPIHVDLSFEEPDAVIEWKVLSKADQSAVSKVAYSVAWADDPKMYMRGGLNTGVFKFILPKHPVQIRIGAPGFKDWSSADSKEFAGPVSFAPGTKDQRTILLEPAK